jgi:ActR/RegA family two-component response regulator
MMSKSAIDEDPKTYIAIVEDDESLCRSLARRLHACGYHPVTYLSAEERVSMTPSGQPLIVWW